MWGSWKDFQGVHKPLKIMQSFMCLDPLLPQSLFFPHSLKRVYGLKVFRDKKKKEQKGRKESKQTLFGFSILLM